MPKRLLSGDFRCARYSVFAISGLALFGNAANALPKVGAAFAVDKPVPTLIEKHASKLRVASDGSRIFTVFGDGSDIRGMLVDAAGKTLLPEMPYYAKGTADSPVYDPEVAYGAGYYLVVWPGDGIWAQLVNKDGIASGEPLLITDLGFAPTVGFVQDRFFVAWQSLHDSKTDIALTTLHVDANGGAVVSAAPTPLITSSGDTSQPRMATTTNGALLAWASNADAMNTGIHCLELDAMGKVSVAAHSLRTAVGVGSPEVASDGSAYLVAWTDTDVKASIKATTVSPGAQASAIQTLAEGDNISPYLSVAGNSNSFSVIWSNYTAEATETSYRHVSKSGQLGSQGKLSGYSPDSGVIPAVLGRGTGYWVSFQARGVLGTLASDDLTGSGAPTALSVGPNSQNSPSMLWDGSNYVLVWADERDGSNVYSGRAVRVNQSGRVLDAASLVFSTAEEGGAGFSGASMGTGGSMFTWNNGDTRKALLRSFDTEGKLSAISTLGIAGERNSGGTSIATDGKSYLVVYPGAAETEFWGQLYNLEGNPGGPAFKVPVPTGTLDMRLLGASGEYIALIGLSAETQIATLTATGNLSTPQQLGTGTFPVEAASGGGKTVLVRSMADGTRIARFWANGNWDGSYFNLGSDAAWGSTVWDGKQFAAVWQDSSYHAHWTTFDTERKVATPEVLFTEECNGPTLASNGKGQLLLSCIRYDADYARRIVNYLLGEPLPDTAPLASTTPSTSSSLPPGLTSSRTDAEVPPLDNSSKPGNPLPSASSASTAAKPTPSSSASAGTAVTSTTVASTMPASSAANSPSPAAASDHDSDGCQLSAGTGSTNTVHFAPWLLLLGVFRRNRARRAG